MSRQKKELYRRKLDELLSRADDAAFLIMCWATRTLQTGNVRAAAKHLEFPEEAANSDLTNRLAIYPWLIETLANELLVVPKETPRLRTKTKTLNCRAFSAMGRARNLVNELENAEDGIARRNVGILYELHRLSQRQFEWQRGFLSFQQLYRSGFLYGGPLTTAYFQAKNGFSLSEYSHACFALRAAFNERPNVRLDFDFTGVSIPSELSVAVIKHISCTHQDARREAARIRTVPGQTAYKPSILRSTPLIVFGEAAVCPLPELISLRAAGGVFYDVIDGPDPVKNEIAARFETYCVDFLRAVLPSSQISPSFKYKQGKRHFDTPDVLISRRGGMAVVLECKARRMSFSARFGDDPISAAARGYDEMAKGAFQIWRYVSHRRRGILPPVEFASDVRGIVVTLDTWLSMGGPIIDEVLSRAKSIARESDPEITDADQIAVRFCHIDDLEKTFASATEDSFFEAVVRGTDDEHRGWMLERVHNKLHPELPEARPYPFTDRIPDVVGDWWAVMVAHAHRETPPSSH
ncbi:MAG: hypothetical protein J0I42_20125 [Bosea sp.]|uniref:hypothetical protein n=1 Tax=Bosea sp. (in: a-proteobacteria) TaxID=1871050 RepID=UPI001ACB02D8|nr:hypothetical protein [Bosea sp. (in: a-proteobacteria)]MBN9454252.1 hypothetical protein [Bosea sp. (in: a-proteobacteria)]